MLDLPDRARWRGGSDSSLVVAGQRGGGGKEGRGAVGGEVVGWLQRESSWKGRFLYCDFLKTRCKRANLRRPSDREETARRRPRRPTSHSGSTSAPTPRWTLSANIATAPTNKCFTMESPAQAAVRADAKSERQTRRKRERRRATERERERGGGGRGGGERDVAPLAARE